MLTGQALVGMQQDCLELSLPIEHGYRVEPGAAFYESNIVDNAMRFNFTNSSEVDTLQGIERLARMIDMVEPDSRTN